MQARVWVESHRDSHTSLSHLKANPNFLLRALSCAGGEDPTDSEDPEFPTADGLYMSDYAN